MPGAYQQAVVGRAACHESFRVACQQFLLMGVAYEVGEPLTLEMAYAHQQMGLVIPAEGPVGGYFPIAVAAVVGEQGDGIVLGLVGVLGQFLQGGRGFAGHSPGWRVLVQQGQGQEGAGRQFQQRQEDLQIMDKGL